MNSIFDYVTSPVNAELKLLIFLIFLIGAVIYLDSRRSFGGRVRSFIDLMFLCTLFLALGSGLRYFGDGTSIGFTADYSLKWFQSLSYVIAGIFSLLAARKMLTILGGEE